ncbi:MAG: zinc ABC transporter substrate-binding protein, partial [Salinivirgaceae bacterium]|nr:zinc ABC transporter substrate-binding protein [Salinivirgaceae bacterium]
MKQFLVSILVLVVWIGTGCISNAPKSAKPVVTVSIIPQQFFVNQIAGDWLEVNVMIPPGGNPHTYEPTPLQMKALSKSSAYFKIGQITFENAWM